MNLYWVGVKHAQRDNFAQRRFCAKLKIKQNSKLLKINRPNKKKNN